MSDLLAPKQVPLVPPDESCCHDAGYPPDDMPEILDPCTTGMELARLHNLTTCCNRDRVDNVWVEGEYPESGICMLDNLTIGDVAEILSRDPRARADLKTVTTIEYYIDLANQAPVLSGLEEGDRLQQQINASKGAGPFYAQFRGQIPPQ